jgi:hypothetical protein
MKKILMLSIVAVMVLSLGLVVFAEADTSKETPAWFTQMIQWKKDQVQKAVDAKEITEEQAKLYMERFDDMEKYHQENGFGFQNGCGFGRGGRGFGGGMMRGLNGLTPKTNSL